MDANRRAVLAMVAAIPTAGCADILTRDGGNESAGDTRTRSLVPDPDERVRVVYEEVDESVPLLSGVVVNFGHQRVDVEVTAEFYREVDGVREVVSTRKQVLAGLYGRNGDEFEIPFPTGHGPEQGVRYDLEIEVTAVFD